MYVGYARVSTQDQTLDLQKDALKKIGCTKIFTDTASGAQAERKGLEEALEFLREGDTLVVWRLDRLGRSLKHLIETITNLNKRKIGFQSLTESIDTTTSNGRLIFNIFASLAEFERDLIRERTKAGLAAARARGRVGGRPKAQTFNTPKKSPWHNRSTTIRTIPLMRFARLSIFHGRPCIGIFKPNKHMYKGQMQMVVIVP